MLVTLVDDSIPFNGMTPAYQPIGGAEKAFASLPAALARQGHVVRAVNRSPNSLGFENVSWIHWEGRKPPITEVLIAFRKPALLEFTRATKARILWVTGPPDYLHRPQVHEVLDRTNAKLVFLGNTHSEAYRTEGENLSITAPSRRVCARNTAARRRCRRRTRRLRWSRPTPSTIWTGCLTCGSSGSAAGAERPVAGLFGCLQTRRDRR